MFCSQCGKQIDDNIGVCPYCGYYEQPDGQAPVQEQYAPQEPVQEQYAPQEPVHEPFAQQELVQEQPVYQPYQPEYPEYQEYRPEYQQGYQQDYRPEYQQPMNAPQAPQSGTMVPMPESQMAPMPPYDNPVTSPAQPQTESKKKRTGMIIGIVAAAVVLFVGVGVLVFFLTAPMRNYNRALELKEAGNYQEAIEIFTDLEDYEDSPDQIIDCKYLAAKQSMKDGEYDEAIEAFTKLDGYQDSEDQITECHYLKAQKLMTDGAYDDAIDELTPLDGYKDSADLIDECNYQKAEAFVADGKHSEALELYTDLGDYKDCADKITLCNYEIAKKDYDAGEYEKAASAFEALGDYKDSKDMLNASNYGLAKSKIKSDPSEAIALFEKLGKYSDSKSLLQTAKMNYCNQNKSNTNKTTYKYLKELKKANYKGADALYKELYSWKVSEVFWNTNKNSTDSKTAVKKISKSKTACLHFKITGGTPGETATYTYYAKHSNGSSSSKSFTTNDKPYWTIYFEDLPTGTLTVTIKNKSGKQVAKSSVTITK